MENTIVFLMSLERETKGAVRYGDGLEHTFYLRKSELRQPYPSEIKVEIKYSGPDEASN